MGRNKLREINYKKLLKADMLFLFENKCKKHGRRYSEHPQCYLREQPSKEPVEKIGIFDLESSSLKANYGHMLSWAVKEHGKNVIHSDLITRKEVRDKNDKRIVKSAVKEIRKYDRLVGFYSARFDFPYLRSRALHHKLDFPKFRELLHTDIYFIVRNKFALHSNRLGAVCLFFGIEAKSTPFTPELWEKAGAGQRAALSKTLRHNKEDVVSTDKVFTMLLDHFALRKASV